MKKFVSVAVMAFVGLAGGSACAQSAASSAEQAIRPVMTKMFKAANAHDTDAFMAAMVHNPKLVFAINGEVIRGWDALHAQQMKWWKNGKSDAKYVQNGARIHGDRPRCRNRDVAARGQRNGPQRESGHQ